MKKTKLFFLAPQTCISHKRILKDISVVHHHQLEIFTNLQTASSHTETPLQFSLIRLITYQNSYASLLHNLSKMLNHIFKHLNFSLNTQHETSNFLSKIFDHIFKHLNFSPTWSDLSHIHHNNFLSNMLHYPFQHPHFFPTCISTLKRLQSHSTNLSKALQTNYSMHLKIYATTRC